MELVGILVVLRRRWILVGLGALASLAAGVVTTHRVSIAPPQLQSRTTEAGVASVQVLADTPRPLLAASQTTGDDTIADRAALLGSLLARGDVKDEIARRAGVKATELAVVDPFVGAPVATPLSRSAVEVAGPSAPNVLTVSRDDSRVPIVSITAEAPEPSVAMRLAKSATLALGSLAGGADAIGKRQVKLEQLGPVDIEREVDGPGRARGLIAAVAIFALWCAAIVVFDRITGRRRPPDAARAVGRHLPLRPARAAAPAYLGRRNGEARDRAGHPGG